MGDFIWNIVWTLASLLVGSFWGYALGITREDKKRNKEGQE